MNAAGTFNLIGDGTGGFDPSANNILGTTGSPITDQLAPLGFYGGPTQTMPVLPNSQALATGGTYNNGFGSTTLIIDQRGQQPANGFSHDIGAFQNVPIVVSTYDADPVALGQLSYQDALNLQTALGGNPPIAYAYSNSSIAPGPDSGYWVTWPASVSEDSSATIDLSYLLIGGPDDVQEGTISWNGGDPQGVEGEGGPLDQNFSHPAAGQTQLTAVLGFWYGPDLYMQLPEIDIAVVPDAPTGLTASAFSTTEVDLAWTDQSAVATQDIIYESTDNGASFQPIDEVTSAGVGVTNNYSATGLTPNTEYQFYITSAADYAESAPSNLYVQNTTFVPPTLDVEGTGTVVEGQPYELDLTASYPNGEPGVVDHWAINWNDGVGGTSDTIDYPYPAGADPTQPLAVFHTFNSGIASPNVTVQAVDTINGSWYADDKPVTVTPVSPASVSSSASGSSITVGWTNASHISTGTTILLGTAEAGPFFEVGGASSGATSTTIDNLNLDTNYWVEALTEGANGESIATLPQNIPTPYVAPSLVVIPGSTSPLQGAPFNLNLSATYADNTPQDDLISTWTINWGDGSGTHNYTGQAVDPSSPTYAAGTLSANISITATDSNSHSITSSQTIYFSPDEATGLGGTFNLGCTAATLYWNGAASTIASEYIVQEIAPGDGAAGWATIATVPVADNTSPDYGDGLGYTYTVNDLAPSAIGGDGGYLFRIGAKTSDATSDTAGSPGVAVYTDPATLANNPTESGPGGVSDSDVSIAAGGTLDDVLNYSLLSGDNPAGTILTVKSYNKDVLQPTVTTITVGSDGDAILPIEGISVGNGMIRVQDAAGDQGVIRCGVTGIGVSSTTNVTQGATYDSGDMPGFTFFIDGPSATAITVNYSTAGSTLPSSLMGSMSSGSATIPIGDTSVFVPFTVPDDGKIAPMRTVVATLTAAEGGDQAYMHVQNTDAPTLTINGQADGAIVPLDLQDSPSALDKIAIGGSWDGTLNYSTFSWDPTQDLVWLTQSVGTAGVDDLASFPGTTIDMNGIAHYRFEGGVPSTLWAQPINGSSDIDSTAFTIEDDISKPATPIVAPAIADAPKQANDQQQQYVITVIVSTPDNEFTPVHPPGAVDKKTEPSVAVGQIIHATVHWDGSAAADPMAGAQNITYSWKNNDGIINNGFAVTNGQDSKGNPIPNGNGAVTAVTANTQSFSFLWVTGSFNGSDESIQCTLSAPAKANQTVKAFFDVFRPNYTVSTSTQSFRNVDQAVNAGQPPGTDMSYSGVDPATGNAVNGITFTINAGTKEPAGFTGGSVRWVQIVNNGFTDITPLAGKSNKVPFSGLDKTYPFQSKDAAGNPVDSPHLLLDGATVKHGELQAGFTMYLMWQPPANTSPLGADWVPIQEVVWTIDSVDDLQNKVWTLNVKDQPAHPVGPKGKDTTDYPTWKQIAQP